MGMAWLNARAYGPSRTIGSLAKGHTHYDTTLPMDLGPISFDSERTAFFPSPPTIFVGTEHCVITRPTSRPFCADGNLKQYVPGPSIDDLLGDEECCGYFCLHMSLF